MTISSSFSNLPEKSFWCPLFSWGYQPDLRTHLEGRQTLSVFSNVLLVQISCSPSGPYRVFSSLLESQCALCINSPYWNRGVENNQIIAILSLSSSVFSVYLFIHLCIHLFNKPWLITSLFIYSAYSQKDLRWLAGSNIMQNREARDKNRKKGGCLATSSKGGCKSVLVLFQQKRDLSDLWVSAFYSTKTCKFVYRVQLFLQLNTFIGHPVECFVLICKCLQNTWKNEFSGFQILVICMPLFNCLLNCMTVIYFVL